MRRGTSIIFFFLVLLPLSVCGQMLLQGRIVDADTGEPLPYAVISSSSHRTLSNRDGNFSLYAMDSEMLTVSFVGFEKKRFIANKLPAIIYLMPQTIEMQEVIVKALPTQDILRHIRKKIHREWLTRSMKRTLYFFRTTIENADHTNEMMEGFYDARSAINIRNPIIVSGQTRIDGRAEKNEIKKTNFQHLFSLAPTIYDIPFWKSTLQPLGNLEGVEKAYETSIFPFFDAEGKKNYKIEFLFNGLAPKDWEGRILIQGTLYVDAQTYGMLHFDGQLLGMRQVLDDIRMGMNLNFHIQFTHERGFTEVSHISFDGGNKILSYHCLLFKVDKYKEKSQTRELRNLVTGIKGAGYEPSMWDKYDIVRRTEAEEQIARKNNTQEP